LDQDVTEEEIRLATFSMQQDKAPGPGWFHGCLLPKSLGHNKKRLCKDGKNVFKNHKMGENTKSSHLALIPKEVNPLSFDRFRPISLCNVSYKIVTKILANRLKKLLPHLISENQGRICPSQANHRQCHFDPRSNSQQHQQRKERGMIIKLDMANALIELTITS
jgi:hypothetical protein